MMYASPGFRECEEQWEMIDQRISQCPDIFDKEKHHLDKMLFLFLGKKVPCNIILHFLPRLLDRYPGAAFVLDKKTKETLLHRTVLLSLPLNLVERIHDLNPAAVLHLNRKKQNVIHQFCVAPFLKRVHHQNLLDNLKFLAERHPDALTVVSAYGEDITIHLLIKARLFSIKEDDESTTALCAKIAKEMFRHCPTISASPSSQGYSLLRWVSQYGHDSEFLKSVIVANVQECFNTLGAPGSMMHNTIRSPPVLSLSTNLRHDDDDYRFLLSFNVPAIRNVSLSGLTKGDTFIRALRHGALLTTSIIGRLDQNLLDKLLFDTQLHKAVAFSDSSLLERYLQSGQFDVDKKGRSGWTALTLATFFSKPLCARVLLLNGANVNLPFGEDQQSCVHIACYFNDVFLLNLLMEFGCLINVTDRTGRSALDYCAFYGSDRCFDTLMAAGAKTSANTLVSAKARNHTGIVDRLCSAWCNQFQGKAMEQTYDKYISRQCSGDRRLAILIAAQNGFAEALCDIGYQQALSEGDLDQFNGVYIRPAIV